MKSVMPSQVVQTIDELFQHAKSGSAGGHLQAGHSSQLLSIVSLVKSIPDELISVSSSDYADLVRATSTIEFHLQIWISRGPNGGMEHIRGQDAITVIRQVLAKCPDEHPPPATTELLFIRDDKLRENIRSDVGAANRALMNSEWKAATVLAGATIEALLHWKLQQPPIDAKIQGALLAVRLGGLGTDLDDRKWNLGHFIKVAFHLQLIKEDTAAEAKLAQDFRNLIHPVASARLAQTCDRGTAYSSIGALEHVIRDLIP